MKAVKTMHHSTFIFLLSLWPTFVISSSIKNVNINPNTYVLDINGDGVNEKVLSDQISGEVSVLSNTGSVLAKGANLSIDGYSVFDKIEKMPSDEKGFVIVNRGGNFGASFNNEISLTSKGFFLTKSYADTSNNIDGIIYSDVHCERRFLIPFNGISSDDVAPILLSETDDNFNKPCKEKRASYFKFSELEQLTKSGKISWTKESVDFFIDNTKMNKSSVSTYNNIAYYIFELSPKNPISLYILNKVITEFPTRTVAYLNIADYYAANSKCKEARIYYNKYITLMKKDGKDEKIPERASKYQTTRSCE